MLVQYNNKDFFSKTRAGWKNITLKFLYLKHIDSANTKQYVINLSIFQYCLSWTMTSLEKIISNQFNQFAKGENFWFTSFRPNNYNLIIVDTSCSALLFSNLYFLVWCIYCFLGSLHSWWGNRLSRWRFVFISNSDLEWVWLVVTAAGLSVPVQY